MNSFDVHTELNHFQVKFMDFKCIQNNEYKDLLTKLSKQMHDKPFQEFYVCFFDGSRYARKHGFEWVCPLY